MITFVEKYRAYIWSAPFKARVDNHALAWLKTYSMDKSYIGRWIVRLDRYHTIIELEPVTNTKMLTASAKRKNFMSDWKRIRPTKQRLRMGFLSWTKRPTTNCDSLGGLTSPGTPYQDIPNLPGHPAEKKMLAKGDPVPLQLVVQSELVQQELTRLGINSIAPLNKAVNVAPDVMLKIRDLLDREVERHDHEQMETMQRLTITEKTETRLVAIWSRDVELVCRSIVNQLVSSIPKDVLLRTSYMECQQSIATQTAQEVNVELGSRVTRRVQFTDMKEEYEPSWDCSSGDETLSGESCTFGLRQDDLSGESTSERPKEGILSGESRNTINKSEDDDAESIGSSEDSQSQLSQPWENGPETTSNSDASEIAIHSLLVEWR